MEDLLQAIEDHNAKCDEDEKVDKKEVLWTTECAIESIIEDIFDIDKIHRKIDRWFDRGEYSNYDIGGISGCVWGLAVIQEVKNKVADKIYG